MNRAIERHKSSLGRRLDRRARREIGTCINVACVPTNALIHDPDTRPAGEDPVAWYSRAVERKDGITAAMRAKNLDMLDRLDAVATITGRAEFVGMS